MMGHYQVCFEPVSLKIECDDETLLSDATRETGVNLLSVCGNKGLCGRCRIKVIAGVFSPPTQVEKELLGTEEIANGYRLSCQTRIRGDVKVYLPSTSLIEHPKIQLEGISIEVPLDPPVEEFVVALFPDEKDDSQSDEERLVSALNISHGKKVLTVDSLALHQLPSIGSESGGKMSVSVREKEIISVRPQGKVPLGLAVDLGTTKIAGYMINLETGRTVAAEGMVNPQRVYGEDVISRIAYAMEKSGAVLKEAVTKGLNELIRKLCPETDRIVEVTIVGNTAMHHLFLELPVRQLGLAPYRPSVWESPDVKARDLGLNVAPGAYTHFLPNVDGFIGGDHVAMILATGIYTKDKTVMGLDIGTNTEIFLAHRGELTSTSCASGPAFEGGHITHGMGAARGAIEKVEIRGVDAVEFQTIDNVPPLGLCGSGILDAVAELCRIGVINRQGRLEGVSGVRQDGNTREFVLMPGGKTGTGQDITITQKDINEIQLAKAAIRTGIETLIEKVGISWEEIEKVIITGGFGSSINPVSALAIGMFPPFKSEQFQLIGNAAGVGAQLCLISKSQRAKARDIAKHIHYLDLMTHSKFPTRFASAMFFQ
jgi:uncharacterized 2Fe-2S/4Fe-4S cluster protein (DUF4445 family)